MNSIKIPKIPHIAIDSVISTMPIVNHQIRKNGFSALRITPAKNEFLVDLLCVLKFFPKIDFICSPAEPNNPIAPKTVISVKYSGNVSNEIIPIPSKIINGNLIEKIKKNIV